MNTLKSWLASLKLEHYLEVFEANSVDLDVVSHLTEADLTDLGVTLGDRKRLIRAAASIASGTEAPAAAGFDEETAAFDGQTGRSIGELRQMTIMFVDLVNSTGLVQELGIEKYRDLLKSYQNANVEAIRENFGYFAQFIGDGVVAYFGFPAANEDDAERAVLTALQIIKTVATIRVPGKDGLSVRIGIATGDVLIDDLMQGARQADNFALGNIPNLAARLQSLADPGQVAISGRTRRLLGRNFQCSPAGDQHLKGFTDPVSVWFVEGSQSTELRFDKRRQDALTPLIGRKEEFTLLQGRWNSACHGEGQAVFLSGEAGLGKSRLAEEVNGRLVAPTGLRLSFQCSPYHENSSFYPIKAHLNYAIGITDSDPADVRGRKLRDFLDSRGGAAGDTLPVLSNLLSAGVTPETHTKTPEEIKNLTIEVLLRYVERAAEKQPVFILFEDLHWIDPSTEELLNALIDGVSTLKVMVLGTYRPEYLPRWTGKPSVTTLSLPRLGTRETRELLEALNRTDIILNGLMKTIVNRSEGVPLFIEEMISMLARAPESGWSDSRTQHEFLFPSNLKDLLRARLDHLSVSPDTVSICAALGRSFTNELVAAVAGRAADQTAGEMANLLQAQILVSQKTETEERFSFRHALIGEVAYEAILPQRARQLHSRIAETMVSRFPQVCARNPEILALHHRKAGNYAAARDTWKEAAGLSLRGFASQEAIAHLNAALSAHESCDADNRTDTVEIELRQQLAVALEMRGWGSPDITSNLEKLITLNEKTGDRDVAFATLHQLIGEHLIAGIPDTARGYCDRMSTLIAEEDEPAFHTLSEHNHGIAALLMGEFDRAIGHFDRALAWREKAGLEEINRFYAADPGTIDTVMRCWAVAWKNPNPEDTLPDLEHTIAVARSQTSQFSRCFALSIIATIFCTLEDPEQARAYAREAHAISDKIEFRYWEAWSSVIMGWAEARLGAPDTGIPMLRDGLERYIATGSGQIVAFSHTLLADAFLCKEEYGEAAARIAAAQEILDNSAIGFHEDLTKAVAAKIETAAARTQPQA